MAVSKQRYQPKSDFLRAVISNDAPLENNEYADANLRLLIELTQDGDRSNRDWATMLLAGVDKDSTEIRAALLRAAVDEDQYVRGEAIVGLANRDTRLALPFVQRELAGEFATLQIFEAAILVAHPSLIDHLRNFNSPSENSYLDNLAQEALTACEKTYNKKYNNLNQL